MGCSKDLTPRGVGWGGVYTNVDSHLSVKQINNTDWSTILDEISSISLLLLHKILILKLKILFSETNIHSSADQFVFSKIK